MNIVIDLGNSYVKIGIFDHINLLKVITIPKEDADGIVTHIPAGNYKSVIISSVVETSSALISSLQKHYEKVVIFDKSMKLPILNKYQSPETLGNDRLALASGGTMLFNKQNILIIDAGSCITYDYVNKFGHYLGGAISPGIDMRFKALNAFTDKLPLVKRENKATYTGQNTNQSILSGVLNGVIAEINASIDYYKSNNKTLKIILTGGDAIFLSKKIKSRIFVEPNFLLISLNQLLLNNE